MSSRAHSRLAILFALLLVATHLDFWRPQRPLLVFGWLPEELLWRLCWMAAAFLYLVYFCKYVWREEG
ncbi:MAG: hypothetical protein ACI8QZ_002174 [Chlamydiales bacterium]